MISLLLFTATIRYDLAFEIQAMAMTDQEMRFRMTRMYPTFENMPKSAFEDWMSVDRKNTARMKQIVGEIGWPDSAKVGKAAAQDAWLLVQHADQDPAFQHYCLNLIKPLVAKGTVRKREYAYLFDRVAVAEKRPQRYGTQFERKNGKWIMKATEDPRNLDKRRKSMDLGPIAEYIKLIERTYKKA